MQATNEPEAFVGLAGERRLRNTEFAHHLVIGTCAFSLGKKANDQMTHKWYLYVRGEHGEDLSPIIKKVVFQLHPTFPNPVREVHQHPFEIQEAGWGEFDIQIFLHFQDDAQEQPMELHHKLKLYGDTDPPNPKKPVMSEHHEEIVFVEPAEAFYKRMLNTVPLKPGVPPSAIHGLFSAYDPGPDMQRLTEARRKVARAIASMQTQADRYM